MQSLWRNGHVIDMSERLEILRPILSQFKRRFSVFSLGSGIEDGLEHEIAKEFDCVVVCTEKDPLRYIPSGRMIVLRREFSAEDLDLLSKCEHFDIVLAMNVLHWYDRDWLKALRALRQLGSDLIIQTPDRHDYVACGKWNKEIMDALWDAKSLGESQQFPGHLPRPIKLLHAEYPGIITSKSFGGPEEVEVTVFGKYACLHHKATNTKFIPGLTLSNFKTLNGVWPPREMICSALRLMKWDGPHRDIQPWNVRIDGVDAYLIDPGGEDWLDSDEENRKRLLEWAEAL